MDKQGKANFVNMTIDTLYLERRLSGEDILAHIIYECSFNRLLLEIALKVSQSILRCGDSLIHGRVNMMRLLMCIMGMFSIVHNKK